MWQPKVTPLAQLRSGEGHLPTNLDGPDPYIQKTSLAADKQEFKAIGSGYNRTARPFAGFGAAASNPPAAAPAPASFAPGAPSFSQPPPAPAPARQFTAGEAAAFAPIRPAAPSNSGNINSDSNAFIINLLVVDVSLSLYSGAASDTSGTQQQLQHQVSGFTSF